MLARVGLQLGAQRARAVTLTGWPRSRVQAVEVPFDPERPDEAVDALRALVGKPRRVALAVDLHLLRTKRVTLPALSSAERRSILRLEPERFFAVRGDEIVPAVRADDGLVFAANASALALWVKAIERIAPVDMVEPTPIAIARALATASISDALILFDGQDAGIGVVEIRDSRVTRARRLFGTVSQVAVALARDGIQTTGSTAMYLDPWTEERRDVLGGLFPGATLEPLPTLGRTTPGGGVAGPFTTAYGAALALGNAPAVAETLLSPAHGAAIGRRRARALGVGVVICAAAFLLALVSVDNRQDRSLHELDTATAMLATRAAAPLAMQTELAGLARRAEAMRAIDAERTDPLRVLRALSTALPPGAFVRQIREAGSDWQVDGYAPSASAILTALGARVEFRDVHFLSAMNRAQIANRPYDSFALAFQFAPAP